MKKLLIMLAVCIILCAMPFTVSAQTLTDVEYIENEILVDTQFVINLDDYSGEGPFDFYGVSIVSIERSSNLLTAEEELERFTFVAYKITIDSSEDILEALETLKSNENIFNAELNAVIYNDIITDDPAIVEPVVLPEGQNSKDIAHLLPDVDYARDELIVYIDYRFDFSEICDEEFKNSLHTYTKGGETFDFFGLKVTEVRLFDSTILPADEWYKEYGYYFYWVTLDPSVSVPKALDIIYPQEHVTATVMGLEHIPEDVPRDVNGDFKVNMFDYMLAKSLYFNSESGTADQLRRADVNKDGKVDVLDMMAIKTYIFNA